MPRGRPVASPVGELLGGMAADEEAQVAAWAGWFARADQDKDGLLSSAEIAADAARFFALMDADGDGGVNARELADYRLAALRPPDAPAPGDAPPGPRRQGPAGEGGGRAFGGLAEDRVMAADRNLDFRVTLIELTEMAQTRLAAMDGDKDGKVNVAEVEAAARLAFNTRPAGMGGGRGRPGGGPGGGGRGPGGGMPG